MYYSKNIQNLFFCFIFIISGLLLSFYLTNNIANIDIPENHKIIIAFKIDVFCKIFFNNLLVGILISVLGFITGGLLSALILFWNGIIVGELLKSYTINGSVIPFFIYHGVFEITAFLCFGIIGMKGLDFYVNLFKYNILKVYFPKNLFLYSTIALFIGAIIETLLISTVVCKVLLNLFFCTYCYILYLPQFVVY
jgi:uncharacterized membrane protein SpoIIM required for sporulation